MKYEFDTKICANNECTKPHDWNTMKFLDTYDPPPEDGSDLLR